MNGWSWRDVSDAIEVAQVLYYQNVVATLDQDQRLQKLHDLIDLLPASRHRSEESELHQHFATPMILSEVACRLLDIQHHHTLLEPSAGYGMLMVPAASIAGTICCNEINKAKLAVLDHLFPEARFENLDAGTLNDRLDPTVQPDRIAMNPPFSSSPGQRGIKGIGIKHIRSALERLKPGGRLVAITPSGFVPENRQWSLVYAALQQRAQITMIATLYKGLFDKSGTGVATNIIVLDKKTESGQQQDTLTIRQDVEDIDSLTKLPDLLPAKLENAGPDSVVISDQRPANPALRAVAKAHRKANSRFPKAIRLEYEALEQKTLPGHLEDKLYEPYTGQAVRIPDAPPHPEKLVQSVALASVPLPKPTYRPYVPTLWKTNKILSAPQLEVAIYAGQAHSDYLAGRYALNEEGTDLVPAPDGFRVRQGFASGDGTGVGKGREISSIIFDNFAQGRKKAVWITKSDKLVKDARRDWIAMGCDPNLMVNLSKYQPGEKIDIEEGILFLTYARGRTFSTKHQVARIKQILDWVGPDFDGVLALDECHELGNAAPGKTDFLDMETKSSLQGKFGLELQAKLPEARVVYASATIATKVEALSFATRLGLWGTRDMPFASREDFMSSMAEGGISALEMVCRDLKASGLYIARALSFEGVTYDMVKHELTSEQIDTYNTFAEAYKILHANLKAALEETNIVQDNTALNAMAKGAALSAFESTKQRLFNHLLTSMAMPTVIKRMEEDIANGDACVVQIISTGEAVMKRRLAKVAPEDRYDLQFDITPKEYIVDYLMHSFPIVLHDIRKEDDGSLTSVPAKGSDNEMVFCQAALKRRERLIEQICSLPSIPSALDQILHHFGTNQAAEITGRNQRIVKKEVNGVNRRILQTRPASANLAEEQAFNSDFKRIIIFSEAGGTGSSYHADRGIKNQRPRRHYLVEPGWRAELAIQGLGRSHRSNQAQAPTFLPVTTNVKGQVRFTSTIVRRLDALGALTRGQRQTGGQGLFDQKDNLESDYAKAALIQFYTALYMKRVPGVTLSEFQAQTGLEIVSSEGELKTRLPPIQRFLNRLLALRIDEQEKLFNIFETFIEREIEAAKKADMFDTGLTTLNAHKISTIETVPVYKHPKTRAQTQAVRLERVQRVNYRPYSYVQERYFPEDGTKLILNTEGHAALLSPPFTSFDDNFQSVTKHRLYTPAGTKRMLARTLAENGWHETDPDTHKRVWEEEVAKAPEFVTDQLYLLTGLLLPLWKKLPSSTPKVVRLRTDEGTTLLGRVLTPTAYTKLLAELGNGRPETAGLLSMVLDGDAEVAFSNGMRLRRSKVMDRMRYEIVEYKRGDLDGLKMLGCFTEIIDYQLRCFIPNTDQAKDILDPLLERYGLKGILSL